MISDYMYYVDWIASKFYYASKNSRDFDLDDIKQEGYIGMLKAIDKRGIMDEKAFSVFLYKYAYGHMVDHIRRLTSHRIGETMPLHNSLDFDLEDRSTVNIDTCLDIESGIKQLTKGQRPVALMTYIEGYNNTETAKILGLSVSAVDVRKFEAKKRLKKHFEAA